jgi:transposase InsO family protein
MLHIDIKELARIERPSHRVTGNRQGRRARRRLGVPLRGRGRPRAIGFTAMHPDEKKASAIAFLHAAVAYYAKLGVTIRRLLTDNGSGFRSKAFVQACRKLGIAKRYPRPYRPQTNGKAERFIQSALTEWAYGFTYQRSAERTAALECSTHHYNWHRPHQGIGGVAPISRLKAPRDYPLTLHT